jgi:hypothetical protein
MTQVDRLKHLGMDDPSLSHITSSDNLTPNTHVQFFTGGGQRAFQERTISYETVREYLKTQSKIYVTASKTICKLRSENNVRIVEWRRCNVFGKGTSDVIVAIYCLLSEYSGDIEWVTQKPKGISYEYQAVKQINESQQKQLMDLNVGGFRMGIKFTEAEKVSGTGKADITLKDGQKEVFWISYKHGRHYSKDGGVDNYVPFQQYGSLQTLYDIAIRKQITTQVLINFFVQSIIRNVGIKKLSIKDVVDVYGSPKQDYWVVL